MTRDIKSLIAACALSSAGAIVYLLSPLIFGGVMDAAALDAGQAGLLLASYFGAYTIIAASGLSWLHRFPTRRVTTVALLMLVAGLIPMAALGSYQVLMATMALSGAGAGACYAVSVALIAATDEPDRNFGYALTAQLALGGILLFAAPAFFTPKWGFGGTISSIILAVLLIGLILPWLPRGAAAQATASNQDISQHPAAPAISGTIGLFIWFAGLSALWVFIERIGVESALDPVAIGTVLSLSVIPGIAGAMSAVVLGDRFGRKAPHIFSALLILIAVFPLSSQPGLAGYGMAVGLIIFAWNFWLAYLLGTLASVDLTGRYSSLYTAALGLGAAVGPAVGGIIAVKSGLKPVLFSGLGAIMAGLLISLWLLSFIDKKGLSKRVRGDIEYD
jgi:predicted MFS family arabinose efflux permease